jgi:hypothetical protein
MEMALSTAAGISHGISYAIPSLLRGEPGYIAFTSLKPVTGWTVNGRDCMVLSGMGQRHELISLAIEPRTCVILQMRTTEVIRNSEIAADVAKAREEAAKTDPAMAARLVAPPAMPDFTSIETVTFTDPSFTVSPKPEDFVYPVPADAKKVDNLLN